ncbi:Uncharacterized protein dnm_084950 [Desulfonema magnum]|uniref:Uncharacterized protein n=1 Tax=Desulfonema magnum TaxID=45655 RepID=A0A975GSU4_9BACT|nr:Uncharacterized protein dnm_084950 [Desulfonema magnum]
MKLETRNLIHFRFPVSGFWFPKGENHAKSIFALSGSY